MYVDIIVIITMSMVYTYSILTITYSLQQDKLTSSVNYVCTTLL